MKRLLLFVTLACSILPSFGRVGDDSSQAIDSIVKYLSDRCLNGYFVSEHRGRNHSVRGQITVNNYPMNATRTLLRGMEPYLDCLPHQRKMTDERAGELLEGRIVMRLQPEPGDTSAYFLLTYNRSNIQFTYGVNSPRSINLSQVNGNHQAVSFSHNNVSDEEVAPLRWLFQKTEQLPDAIVRDTVFRYDQPGDYFWWSGDKGERSRTRAKVVVVPSGSTEGLLNGAFAIFPLYRDNADITVNQTKFVEKGRVKDEGMTAIFCNADTFHVHHIERINDMLCAIHAQAGQGEYLSTIPASHRIISGILGQHEKPKEQQHVNEKFERLLLDELAQLKKREDARNVDTLFVSNDHEGHFWWNNMNQRCPTRATVVRTAYTQKELESLRQRLLKAEKGNISVRDEGDEASHFMMFSWQDSQQLYHSRIIIRFAEGYLVMIRADGEDPNSICIPKYKENWFK
jgi:hypothetical protein